MNKLLLILFLSISVLSCSKSDDSKKACEFIGKWCQPNPATGDCIVGVQLEFRSNGDLLLQGTTAFTWKSDDCKTIDVIHKISGQKSAEYKVTSISANNMTIDIGAGPTDMVRVQ